MSIAAAAPSADSAPPRSAVQPHAVVHKFGGTSVADADCYRHVARLLQARPEALQVTVVSAMKGVTDALIALARLAAAGDAQWREDWHDLRARHRGAAASLLGEHAGASVEWLDARFDELAELLAALAVIGGLPEEVLDRVQGLGEVCSAHLLGQHFQASGEPCAVLDAREVLVVEHGELGVNVDWETSAQRLHAWRQANVQQRIVVTGFIARDRRDRITTLGRNGSDYSGAIFAALFNADELQIWTDVDGVLSADPRLVPEAVQLEALSYDEACELAYFGAKVVHPQTMSPAIQRGLPILIRNTFQPEHPGTRITAERSVRGPIKGLTLSAELAVLNLEGTGLIGVPGTAERVFSALRQAQVSVVMISQGSSEHSICCVVRGNESERGRDALLQAFAHELAVGQVQRVQLRGGVSVLAAVGDGMAGQPGVAARLFESLGRAQVNILAIAQGSSERNISVAVDSGDATRALRAAHAGFWLSPQTFAVGVIGPGNVGAALLDQLQAAQPQLLGKANIDLRLRAVASRRGMHLAPRALQGPWRAALADAASASDLDAFTAHLLSAHLPHAVVIDCSGSAEVAGRYEGWLAAGIHVVTPNKQAGSGPLARYQSIRAAAAASGARFRYEATVGAGLPVITTLRDLVDTGDEVLSIEGIFSGTLAWLFNRFDGSQPFSALVEQARGMGYTEPDPRDDLSGIDVARKLVILAREAGRDLSLEQVQVESLVPEALRAGSVEAFMQRLGDNDDALLQRLQQARARGAVLRYVAALSAQGASVGLVEIPLDHAFANLKLTDNVVQFRTRRYCDNPLVVQGPGAGPEVTAAGVFADLLRVAAGEGARL
ncbi:aspartate kinase [Stenotrophomonas maltophilia]|uniref:bifunctional aspartate kinase/homoserine dehydrogenase I n=1 Tax=Stenotrophomonas chelatiphaga TaxID=517011 RepID=UPI000F4BC452|nr:bifunctional aspartate kinase/homoserine dehydrogenase I [Stenotrophomonas chelatiphaga]MCS4229698.1 aspartokinase/homoserine dehydrogenase 1 [Stenotrophomonas chelatiphaga]ROQ36940.1 aspartate kinase [Stenotrophomonas maltophilia]